MTANGFSITQPSEGIFTLVDSNAYTICKDSPERRTKVNYVSSPPPHCEQIVAGEGSEDLVWLHVKTPMNPYETSRGELILKSGRKKAASLDVVVTQNSEVSADVSHFAGDGAILNIQCPDDGDYAIGIPSSSLFRWPQKKYAKADLKGETSLTHSRLFWIRRGEISGLSESGLTRSQRAQLKKEVQNYERLVSPARLIVLDTTLGYVHARELVLAQTSEGREYVVNTFLDDKQFAHLPNFASNIWIEGISQREGEYFAALKQAGAKVQQTIAGKAFAQAKDLIESAGEPIRKARVYSCVLEEQKGEIVLTALGEYEGDGFRVESQAEVDIDTNSVKLGRMLFSHFYTDPENVLRPLPEGSKEVIRKLSLFAGTFREQSEKRIALALQEHVWHIGLELDLLDFAKGAPYLNPKDRDLRKRFRREAPSLTDLF